MSLIAPTGVGAEFDAATDTDVTDVFIYGSTISGFSNGIKLNIGHEFIGCTVINSGLITVGTGATLVNTSVSGSTATAALLWDVNLDPSGYLDGMGFSMGTAGHGIQLGSNTPTTINFNGITFNNYGADGTANAALYNNSGKTITINVIAGTTPTVLNGSGASTIIVAGAVTVTINVKDATSGSNIQNARVLVETSDGTGPFPYRESVTITRSGSTATVVHTGHGMATNDKVAVRGANQQEYNGIKTITVTGIDEYTFGVSGVPDTPATGIIISSFISLEGLTDAFGNISSFRVYGTNQPITGNVRKASSSPYKCGGHVIIYCNG